MNSHPLLAAAGALTPATIDLETLVVGPGAVFRVTETATSLFRGGHIAMLEDATPMLRGDIDLKELVAGLLAPVARLVRTVLGPDDGRLHADADAVAAATEAASKAGLIVTVGSGTISDVGKEASRLSGVPLICVQTAASVNGYADDLAVLLKDGVKRTSPSVWPRALIIDSTVLGDAPAQMTRSGLAEMMAMFTAPADWKLAQLLGYDDSFDAGVVDLFRKDDSRLIEAAPAIGAGEHGGLEVLAAALTASGLAMGVAHRTAPLSGTEHLISHLLDMSAKTDGRPVGLHGAQVGVSSLVAACLWERLLRPEAIENVAAFELASDADIQAAIADAFDPLDGSGRMAAECWSDVSRKLGIWRHLAEDRQDLAERLTRGAGDLLRLVGDPEQMSHALAQAGAPRRYSELAPAISPERVRWALRSSPLMRNRFTAVDLAFFSGSWNETDIEAVLERAAELGGGV